jgi:hypothetical protein
LVVALLEIEIVARVIAVFVIHNKDKTRLVATAAGLFK